MTSDLSDRELLELAAKAAGLQARSVDMPYGRCFKVPYTSADGLAKGWREWNPLTDDGDALRLAVKLNLHVEIDCESAGAVTVEWGFDQGGEAGGLIEEPAPAGGDDAAATRRAIVRAAAEIGRTME